MCAASRLAADLTAQHRRILEAYRRIGRWVPVRGVEIVGPPDCAAARAMRDVIYPLGAVPDLPLEGCAKGAACTCAYRLVT